MYAEADASALERRSTSELDLKSKELSPQNCKIKELEGTAAAKLSVRGSTLWSMGSLLHLSSPVNKECIKHKPVLKLLKEW